MDRDDFIPFSKADVDQSIPQRFADQVRLYPDRLAVKSHDKSLTYRNLDLESNRIANAILRICGGGEQPVVLLMEQGAMLVTAILAALKAGKIYGPQDSASPLRTVQRVLEESAARLIIADDNNISCASELACGDLPILNVNDIDETFQAASPRLRLLPGSAAYIFYTSGSTGAPKGVVDSHRNVLHNVMRYTNSLRIGPQDRLSLVQSCSFSGSVSNIFCALLNGASVFPFDLRRAGAYELASWANRERLTIFHSVPLIFEQLLSGGKNLANLRTVRLEGDQATRKHVGLFQRYLNKDCQLVNGLGTTETGLVCQFFLNIDTDIPGATVPIGYAIEDMEILLLDEESKQVAVGQVGEIAVRSRYLAIGYWGRTDLTDAAFKKDAAGKELRTYLTGDMGSMEPDGCLNYLGRKDFQIKVRGQRVDVAALESAIAAFEGVKDVVIVARENVAGSQQLVAYVVIASAEAPTVNLLRSELSKNFPSYAIPSKYVVLDALPLDRNGKVLRLGLPAPGNERPRLDQTFFAPRTRLEKALVKCFRKVLGVTEIGIHDDFFDLGGDSLNASSLP